MDYKKVIQSNLFKKILCVIGVMIIALIIFQIGMFVGFRKAKFSYKWGENYHRNFAGPKGGFMGDFRRGLGGKDFLNSHGVFGGVAKIDGNNIIVKEKDEEEKSIVVSASTTIQSRFGELKISDLKVDDKITVIGAPNEQGQIEARIIRLFK